MALSHRILLAVGLGRRMPGQFCVGDEDRFSVGDRIAVTTWISSGESVARRWVNHDGRCAPRHAKWPQPAHVVTTGTQLVVHRIGNIRLYVEPIETRAVRPE